MRKVEAGKLLDRVRACKPLVHHITNWVTIYDCAAIVKVFGASPVMAHAEEEAADMAGLASALVLNIGTLTPGLVRSMIKAASAANRKGIPVVLDVCGAGATKLRDRKCFEILGKCRVDVLKGNASEIARIAGENVRTKGVDSGKVLKGLAGIAEKLARERRCVVVITGKQDIVTDGKRTYAVRNGHPLMASVVGTGCMAASVIGAFCAVEKDYTAASAAALACYESAAETAAGTCGGPGTFKEKLFDAAYKLTSRAADRAAKVSACWKK